LIRFYYFFVCFVFFIFSVQCDLYVLGLSFPILRSSDIGQTFGTVEIR
jgi:hypothetical protein